MTAPASADLQRPRAAARQPTIYIPHGGGPWPFVDTMGGPAAWAPLRTYLERLPASLPAPPTALLVVSAHWEVSLPTVTSSLQPPMVYDYSGFPAEAYRIEWPASGDRALAARVRSLLSAANLDSADDPVRGFDHGTFVPMKVAWPRADVPTVQLSLVRGLDPEMHLRIGRALAPLRDEGILIVGSGMSYHDMRGFGTASGARAAETFDTWLRSVVTGDPNERDGALAEWTHAPAARDAHPREEHLLPLMVVSGAAGADHGRITFNDRLLGTRVSAVHFGG